MPVIYDDHPTRAAVLRAVGSTDPYPGVDVAESVRIFVVRYRPDLNTEWQVVWQNRVHIIAAIEPIAQGARRNGWLRLVCDTANTENLDVKVVQTGPQPVFGFTSTDSGGTPTTRTNYDVSTLTGNVVDQPAGDGTTSVSFMVADPTPSGKYIIFLYPQDWPRPTAYYTGTSTAINQIGAFRFVPANLLGSTSQFSHRYQAMVSINRKATDTPISDTVVW